MASLKQNTIFLYALTGSNYLFGLAIIPYLTRVLGPTAYGRLGFAMAVGVYFNLIIDFGFLLSGTEKVSKSANDNIRLSKLFTSISAIKITYASVLSIVLYIAATYIDAFRESVHLLYLFLLVSLFNSLLPDYLYRGLEDMKMITIRGVSVRAIFTILIFIFLRNETQVYYVPLFQLIGGILACIWVYFDIKKRYKIKICKVSIRDLIENIKNSYAFFLSRIASSIYTAANTIIIGLILPGSPELGYYTSSEKFKNIASQGCSPIADSFYPYMIRTKDYKKLLKVLIIFEIPIIIICILSFIYASDLCIILFGEDYKGASIILKWMLPAIAMVLPAYMLGFPALTPIGKSKWANISVEAGTLNQILGLVLLYCMNSITVVSICAVTLLSESIVLMIRIVCFVRYKKLQYE